MAVTIGSNIVSLNAQRQLGKATESLSTISERLSSGQRINKASDDAAGLAVSTSLNSQARIFGQSIRNLNDGITVNAISDGATQNMTEVLDRISELTTQSLNGTFNQKQRNVMDLEAQALRSEFNRIVDTTTFNGIKLFDENSDIRIQAGNSTVNGSIALNSSNLGVGAENNGLFTVSTNTNLNFGAKGGAYGDFNNDGVLDIAASGADTTQISLGNGDGSFKYGTQLTGQASVNYANMEAVDLDGDGNLDIVRGSESASQKIDIYKGRGDGTFSQTTLNLSGAGSNFVRDIEIGDLNGDGIKDFMAFQLTGGVADLFFGNSDGSFQAARSLALSSIYGKLVDVNNDGALDIIANGNGGNKFTVSLGSTSNRGTFAAEVAYALGPGGASSFDVNDVNNDGINDVVVNNYTQDPNGALEVFIGNGNGTFKYTTSVSIAIPTSMAGYPSGPTFIKDMNGDGKADLLTVTSEANGALTFVAGNGDGTFKASVSFAGLSIDSLWEEGTIADFNSDDIQDVAFSNSGTSGATIFFGQGSRVSTLNEFSIKDFGSSKSTLNMIERARNNLLQGIGKIGADRSRLTSAVNVLRVQRENYFAAGSRIMDSDVASESSDYAATKIRQQAAVSVLAQANLQPQIALQLLRG